MNATLGYVLLGLCSGLALAGIVHTAVVVVRMKRRFNRGVKA